MAIIYDVLTICLNVLWFLIIAHFVMSWLIAFQVLNLRQPLVSQIWYSLNQLLEPIYAPIRRFMPRISGIDLAPLVAIILVIVLQRALVRNVGFFYGY